jgi:tetratricopeptide (TPR) repeat protein
MALNNLAFVLHKKGDLGAAITMSRESLDMYQRTVGDGHPSEATGKNNLAMWLIEDKDYVAAEQPLREALELRVQLLGPEHPDVAGSMILLADLFVETERYAEALDLAVEAKAVCIEALGSDHWRCASAASAEGAALAGLGRVDEAEVLLLQSVEVLQNDADARPYYVSSAARWLRQLHRSMGKPE